MELSINIDVASLDPPHLRALEDVVGRPLGANQRLSISVSEVERPADDTSRPAQQLEEWTSVYEGLSDAEIDEIDAIAKSRADLSRDVP